MPPPLSLSISRTQQSRLPYPLGLYWLRAQQARTPLDVYLATEGILRTLTALVLCEAIHAPMTAEQETLLRGGPERRAFERPTFGRRIELLRAAVALHAGVERPILEGVQAWWEQFDGARGVLQRLAEARNEHAHGAAPMGEAASDESRRTALTQVAELIRAASFATAVQLVHVEGALSLQRMRIKAHVRRLAGAAPYSEVAAEAQWPPAELSLEEGRIYLGSADGTRWLLAPFVHLEPGNARSGGHPRPCVLDAIDRRGRMRFVDAHTAEEVHGNMPDAAWEPVDWQRFLDERAHIVEGPGWRQWLSRPAPSLTFVPATELADGLRVGAVIDGFRFVQKLGEGGAAVVWEVEDVDDGRSYALKALRPEVAANPTEVRRFDREVALTKRLYAEGCVHVVGPVEAFRVQDGDRRRVVLRMPLLQGNLKAHVAELSATQGGRELAPERVVPWLRACLRALVELHARGIVHRDIKPSNFLLDADGKLFVADLGVARNDDPAATLTRTGEVVGTDVYMAPEQRQGSHDVEPRADVYSLAVTIDEFLTGTPRVTPGKGVAGTLGDLLRRMGAADVDHRPTALAALAEVEGWDAAAATPATTPPVTYRSPTEEVPTAEAPRADGTPTAPVPVPEPAPLPPPVAAPALEAPTPPTRSRSGSFWTRRRGWAALALVAVAGGVVGLRASPRLRAYVSSWGHRLSDAPILQPESSRPALALRSDVPPPPKTPWVVMLDASEGGADEGEAVNHPTWKEKDLNLAAVQAVAQRLQARGAHFKVVLTRAMDQTVSINARIDASRALRPDVFLSVGTDSLPGDCTDKARGFKVVWSAAQRERSAAQRSPRLAAWMGAAMTALDFRPHTMQGSLHDPPGAAPVPNWAAYGSHVARPTAEGGAQGYALLRNNVVPAIQIATHFLCSRTEVETFNAPARLEAFAEAVERGLFSYFAPPAAERSAPGNRRTVRAGIYGSRADAEDLRRRLDPLDARVEQRVTNGTTAYEVHVGAAWDDEALALTSDAVRARLPDGKERARVQVVVDSPTTSRAAFGYDLTKVHAGTYSVGSDVPGDQGQGWANDRHDVVIGHAFAIGTREVSRAEYTLLTGDDPTQRTQAGTGPRCNRGELAVASAADQPVYCVSWYEAVAAANAASAKEGLQPCYTISGTSVTWPTGLACTGYRLPTEAEWEVAARAGAWSVFAGGDDLAEVGWFLDNAGGKPHPVGTKAPNLYGLYDMSGGVFEWTWDLAGPYAPQTVTDPTGAVRGKDRVFRGGSWRNSEAMARLAYRPAGPPDYRDVNLGFRLARTVR